MTTDPELTRIVRSWLAEGVTDVPERVLDSVMAELPATPQRRRWMPAWRDASMNSYLRFAAAAVVVSVLVVGGIAILRPSLSGGQAVQTPSSTSSPTSLLPLAPGALCRYIASLEIIGAPGGPTLVALENAASGDLTDWKRLGPDLLLRAQAARQELQALVGLPPAAAAIDREASTLDAWIAALQASFAAEAGRDEINRVYSTYADWQTSQIGFVGAMQQTYETACP
jgi:hypothetical protein